MHLDTMSWLLLWADPKMNIVNKLLILPALVLSLVLISCGPDSREPAGDEDTSEGTPSAPLPLFESSFEAVANMGVGWNLGNTLEPVWAGETDGRNWKEWETGWGQAVTTQELIYMMRDAGFGAIRVPVSWGVHMDTDGKVYDEWMNRVRQVVDYVINAGLYCIINVHHDTGADEELAWLVADPLVVPQIGRQPSSDNTVHFYLSFVGEQIDYVRIYLYSPGIGEHHDNVTFSYQLNNFKQKGEGVLFPFVGVNRNHFLTFRQESLFHVPCLYGLSVTYICISRKMSQDTDSHCDYLNTFICISKLPLPPNKRDSRPIEAH